MARPLDDIRPKRIRRGQTFTCEKLPRRCGSALCDACTAWMVSRLTPQVARECKTGNWWTFNLVWTVHRYADDKLLTVNIANLKRAIRKKLVDVGMNGYPIIAGIDVDLEVIAVGRGARFWQIHVHGFIEVGEHKRAIQKKLNKAFRAGAPLDLGDGITLPVVRSPVVFKPIGDLVNWVSYSLKEPSRIVDKRVTMYVLPKSRDGELKQSHPSGNGLGAFLERHRAGRAINQFSLNQGPVLQRLRQKMSPSEFDLLHQFLRPMRVRDRLFLQLYDFRRSGDLVRLVPPLRPKGSGMENKPRQVKVPIIGAGGDNGQKPMKAVRTRNRTAK